MIKATLADGRVLLFDGTENVNVLEEYESKAWGGNVRLREEHTKAADIEAGAMLVFVRASGFEWRDIEVLKVAAVTAVPDLPPAIAIHKRGGDERGTERARTHRLRI